MTRVDGGETIIDMLHYCYRDIVRDYPKEEDDDEISESDDDAENLIIGQMSPRGLYRYNEDSTR